MAVKLEKINLVDGGVGEVDTTPKYALGKEFEDTFGRKYRYIKATAALTAGTAVAEAGYTAIAGLTAVDGGAKFTGATPSTTNGKDLVGQFIKVTRSGSVLGIFPVLDGEGKNLTIPEVKAGDTLDLVAYAHGLAGGSGTALVPMAAIASGSYGFVLVA